MELVVKAAVICVVVALTAVLLQRDTPEMSLLLVLAAIAAVMTFALGFYHDLREMALTLLAETGLDGTLFLPILKIIAISLISRLGGDVCKDSGQSALASLVDMAGTVCALLAAQPLLYRALEILVDLGGYA